MSSFHAAGLPAVASSLLAVSLACAQPAPIRIMPLGDSITYGSNTPGGYRLPLYQSLTNAGYSVDYVGTRTDNGATGLPDSEHQGLSGWTIGQINDNIIDWLYAVKDPDVILLHIGTNDSGAGDFSNRIDRLDSLITKIATNRPHANIIVTTLMKRGEPYYTAITNYFNPYVPGKVDGQRTLGRKVHFLDMHAKLELTDMFDNLHPNAGGYAKMASAWFSAITNVVGVYGDTNAPAIARAVSQGNYRQVAVTFSKAVNATAATDISHYSLSGGLTITGASLSADKRTVTLTTSAQTRDTRYTLTVSDVTDLSTPTPLTVAPGSTASFKATYRGYLNNIPEAANYQLAYAVNLPLSAAFGTTMVPYFTDNKLLLNGPLSRVAYYLELQTLNGDLNYVWVSMDAFTNDVSLVGVPALINRTVFQKYVSNMNVACNTTNVTSGTNLTGNIEFWPSNYSNANSPAISGGRDDLYDFSDSGFSAAAGYGSMQVHNPIAKQTVFAFNSWGGSGATPDIGIGTKPGGHPDWTFSNNIGDYPVRTLYVLVTLGTDTAAPTLVSAQAGSAGTLVAVTFSEPLAADSLDGSRFALDNGVGVVSTTLLPDLRTVNLTTTPQPLGTPLTLTVTGVRDSAGGNPIAPNSTIAVTAASVLPPEITANAGALADGYQLVYTLDVPVTGAFNSSADPYRYNQSLATGGFDRVAYYLEVVKADLTTQYIWTSMDAFTPYRKQIGVPTAASKAVFQQLVSNLVVQSNVAGVSNGTFSAGGNLEFWPNDYSGNNAIGIPNAGTGFDFGDTRSTGGGHGSMQVHNHLAKQTLFAMNNWGSDNQAIALGIGNRPTGEKDWTFANNAGTDYARRTLHILVRPSELNTNGLPAEIAANVPGATGYQLVCSITNIPMQTLFQNATNYYTFDKRSLVAPNSFSRVAYYLELQSGGDPVVTQFVWTAMDTFTPDPTRIGVPVNGIFYQQRVNNLDVFSNVGGLVNGNRLTTGNIEFWPSGYSQGNSIGIPNASGTYFDFGDGGANSTGGGYGSMQVHNYGASQTVFAINNFNTTNAGNTVCLGIGNRPATNDTDWTHAQNAGDYNLRRSLHVLVLPGGDPSPDLTRPTLATATGAQSLDKAAVHFSETLADNAATPSFFTLNNGVTVSAARLLPNKRGVILTTSPQVAGQNYTVTVTGVRDRSAAGNLILPGSTVAFTAPALTRPNVLTNVTEAADYALIHHLAISNTVNYANGCNYTVDESLYQTQAFDRISYVMELVDTGAVSKWVYVSMNAFSADLSKIGVPTPNRGATYQQYVSNLNIFASATVTNLYLTTNNVPVVAGNLEFWPSNYGASNDRGIPGASAATYDFGDSGGNTSSGHGSMQIHNYLSGQTIFALNHFGANGFTPELGIGSRPTNDPDWTFANNAGSYTTKNLYVLVRWGNTPAGLLTGTVPSVLTSPASRTVLSGEPVSFFVRTTGATAFQWRRNGVWILGATQSWLELNPASLADAGSYDVLVFGSGTAYATSQSATLTVLPLGSVLIMK